MNFFNKPPMNKIFGNGSSLEKGSPAPSVQESQPHAVDESIDESGYQQLSVSTEARARLSDAWDKARRSLKNLALAGILSATFLEGQAADHPISASDLEVSKQDFIESMKSLPAENLANEDVLISYAQGLPKQNIQENKGKVSYDKGFVLGNETVKISYENDQVVMVAVKETRADTSSVATVLTKAKNEVVSYDGYLNPDGTRSKRDGIIDHYEIKRVEASSKDGQSKTERKVMATSEFTSMGSGDGASLVFKSGDMGYEARLASYMNSQNGFSESLKAAADAVNSTELASN
jgi:hypothetical protein